MSNSGERFSLGGLALPIYAPTFLWSTGTGAILPVVPALATSLGADLGMAGLITALYTIGALLGNVPAGIAIQRFGERASMLGAAGIGLLGTTVAVLLNSLWLLGLAMILIGIADSVFGLARHAFLTAFVPMRFRARALSTLGGMFRLGIATGPFAAAGVIALLDDNHAVFLVPLVTYVAAVLFLLSIPELPGAQATRGRHEPVFRAIYQHRSVLLTAGLGITMLAAVRTSKQVILPLWAVYLGIDPVQTSLIIGLGYLSELTLFYLSGWIMDRYGRLLVVVPTISMLALGHVLLTSVSGMPDPLFWFIIVNLVMGLATGFGAGIVLTLGSDLAPDKRPAGFLAGWHLFATLGTAISPLWVAGITAAVSIGAASLVSAGAGLIGTALFVRYLPKLLPVQAQGRRKQRRLETGPIEIIQAEDEPFEDGPDRGSAGPDADGGDAPEGPDTAPRQG